MVLLFLATNPWTDDFRTFLVGHTALRGNHMDRLDRAATADEIDAMRAELRDALALGALGLSTGLAYASAHSASARPLPITSVSTLSMNSLSSGRHALSNR